MATGDTFQILDDGAVDVAIDVHGEAVTGRLSASQVRELVLQVVRHPAHNQRIPVAEVPF